MALVLEHSSITILFAGISFLLLGLSIASETLQKLAANQIRRILSRLEEGSFMAVVIGGVLTLMMQSSGALTATLVNLGTARVLTLAQVMGVLIGSAIGTAVTVQLISLNVAHGGLVLFVIGFLGSFLTKKKKLKRCFEFLLALGLLFFGLELIRMGSGAFFRIATFASAIEYLKTNWAASLLVSVLMTTIFHSSTATLGVIMGLAASNVLTVTDSLIWIYGANIGTTSTAIMASVNANYLGRQIAWANLLYRTASVVIFVPFSGLIVFYIVDLVPTDKAQIAALYLILNVFAASIFFPLRGFGVRVIRSLITPSEGEADFGVKFLKRSSYESFALGLAHAKREILEMGDLVYQMAEASIDVFRDESPELVSKIRGIDDKVDLLLGEIKLFLIRVSDLAPEGLNQSVIDVISFGSDLEGAADIIDHHLLDLSKKKRKLKLEFNSEAWSDLERIHQLSMKAISLAMTHFQTEDLSLASQMVALKHETREVENRSRESHIERLNRSSNESIGMSAIYLEILSTYLQLVEALSRHAQRINKSALKGDSYQSDR